MTYLNNHFTQIPDCPDYYICKDTSEILSTRKYSPYIMKQSINSTTSNSTYYMVRLVNEEGNTVKKYIHRLLAELFITNDDLTKQQVNHIDGDKHNNSVDNLEWVTQSENTIHAYSTGLCKSVKVYQYDIAGTYIAEYPSIIVAEKATGIHNPNITKVLKGKRKTAGGFVWKTEQT